MKRQMLGVGVVLALVAFGGCNSEGDFDPPLIVDTGDDAADAATDDTTTDAGDDDVSPVDTSGTDSEPPDTSDPDTTPIDGADDDTSPVDAGDDSSDAEEDTTPLPPREPDPSPVAEFSSRPSIVAVRVFAPAASEDEEATPMKDVAVRLDGVAELTDEFGLVEFRRVRTGNRVLTVAVEGFATVFRRVPVREGTNSRIDLTLRRKPDPVVVAAGEDIDVADGAVSIAASPSDLVLPDGTAHEGSVLVDLVSFDPDPEAREGSPIAYAAISSDGEETGIEPVAAFEASMRNEDGLPLSASGGGGIGVQLGLPDGFSLGDGETLSAWSIDPSTGAWREQSGVDVTVSEGEGGRMMASAELPHFSTWTFSRATGLGCGTITFDPGDVGIEWFQVRLTGPSGFISFSPEEDEPTTIEGLVPGSYAVWTMLAGIPEGGTEVLHVTAGTECAEVSIIGLRDRARVVESGECGRVRLTPVVDNCAASGMYLELKHADDDAPAIAAGATGSSLSTPVEVFRGLKSGEWTATLYDRVYDRDEGGFVIGNAMGERTFTVPDTCPDSDDSIPQVTIDSERDVDRGNRVCVEVPCSGAECDTCVTVAVQTPTGAPIADRYVSFYDPVGQAFPTNADGEVCVDLPGGAGRDLLIQADSGESFSLRLPRGGSCGADTCVRRVVRAREAAFTCPEGMSKIESTARRMGFRDPGYTGPTEAPAPASGSASFLRNFFDDSLAFRTMLAGAISYGDVSRDTTSGPKGLVLVGETYAFREKWQDETGREFAGDYIFRTQMNDVLLLDIEVSVGGQPELAAGTYDVAVEGDGKATLTITLRRMDDESEEGLIAQFIGTTGQLAIDELDGGFIVRTTSDTARVDLRPIILPEEGDADRHDLSWNGRVESKIYSLADTRTTIGSQRSHYLNGVNVDVIAFEEGTIPEGGFVPSFDSWVSVYGPSGSLAIGEPRGQVTYCVPQWGFEDNERFYMYTGSAFEGTIRPQSSLQVWDGTFLRPLHGAAGSERYSTLRVKWFKIEYLEQIYRENDWPTGEMYTGTSIIGVARKAGVITNVSRVEAECHTPSPLEPGSTYTRQGIVLDREFSEATAGSQPFFAMRSILPAPLLAGSGAPDPNHRCELRIYDDRGAEIEEMTQQFIPMRGTVLLPHD